MFLDGRWQFPFRAEAHSDGEPGGGAPESAPPSPAGDPASEAPSTPDGEQPAGETAGDASLYAGKYKTVEELEKGYREATGRLRELGGKAKAADGVLGAPEESDELAGTAGYSTENWIPEGVEVELNLEDPLITAVLPEMRSLGLSQGSVDKLAQAWVAAQAKAAAEAEEALQKQLSILGENANERIADTNQFLLRKLPKEHAEAITSGRADTAAFWEGLELLRGVSRPTAPADPEHARAQQTTLEDLERKQMYEKDENGNRRYETDPAFRRMIQEQRRQILGDAPAIRTIR